MQIMIDGQEFMATKRFIIGRLDNINNIKKYL